MVFNGGYWCQVGSGEQGAQTRGIDSLGGQVGTVLPCTRVHSGFALHSSPGEEKQAALDLPAWLASCSAAFSNTLPPPPPHCAGRQAAAGGWSDHPARGLCERGRTRPPGLHGESVPQRFAVAHWLPLLNGVLGAALLAQPAQSCSPAFPAALQPCSAVQTWTGAACHGCCTFLYSAATRPLNSKPAGAWSLVLAQRARLMF